MVVQEEEGADRAALVGGPLVQTAGLPVSFHVHLDTGHIN